MYTELKDQGLLILSVNCDDDPQLLQEYLRKRGPFPFPVVLDGRDDANVAKKYGVYGYPTNYLLDSEGKVVGRWMGFDGPAILAALQGVGIRTQTASPARK